MTPVPSEPLHHRFRPGCSILRGGCGRRVIGFAPDRRGGRPHCRISRAKQEVSGSAGSPAELDGCRRNRPHSRDFPLRAAADRGGQRGASALRARCACVYGRTRRTAAVFAGDGGVKMKSLLIVAGMLLTTQVHAEEQVFYRGKMSGLVFCEGGDGELSLNGKSLAIVCSDRRATAITLSSPASRLSNFYIDCDCTAIKGDGPGGLFIENNTLISR
jgi:hypothetical protein